ncbi:SNF2-related protein [Paenibacillus amylolyticus]|uniref:SNF2-related protein n=1 Tax=Paenibacillus amylolyticus TaxID=1451 RepID=UPI00339331AF
MKKVGKLYLMDDQWVMENIPPHISIRLKQLFPRVPKWQTDRFVFPNDTTHCADISWFTQRYPLEMTEIDMELLQVGNEKFNRDQLEMEQIMHPDYIPSKLVGLREGQKVRLYQAQASALCYKRGSLLLGDDVGLGKTYSAAAFMLEHNTLPTIVVMQTHLQIQWQEKLELFTTLRVHKIKGTRPYNLPEADVYLFRYSQLLGWIDTFEGGFFKTVIFDEIQELRTGVDSGKGRAAFKLSKEVKYRLGLSATPIYNYGTEIWNIMEFIEQGVLGSYDEFVREWCTGGARSVRDPDALGTYLREQNVMLRRTKRDVGQQMPPVNVIVEHIDSNRDALKSVEDLARQLAMKVTYGTFIERGQAGRELDLLVRHATGVSKAHSVAQYAKLLLDAEIPIMLVGWHRDVYDIWLEELSGYAPAMYTGSESEKQKNESVRRFIEGETSILIMSLRSGAGIDGLQYRCSTVIAGELDWSPKVHEQVIGRVNREGQVENITAIYLNTDEGSDPPMVEILGIKASQSLGIMDPGKQLEAKHSDKSHIKALAQRFIDKKLLNQMQQCQLDPNMGMVNQL